MKGAEGHELNVLRGASGLIERSRPIFLVEAENRHRFGATASIFDFFRTLNYEGFFLRGGEIMDIDAFDAELDQDQNALLADGGRASGRHYVNNFFFFPIERDGRHYLGGPGP